MSPHSLELDSSTEVPPLITLEEHFFTSAVREPATYSEPFKHLPKLRSQMHNLDRGRLAEMDAGAVSMQVISHGPHLAPAGAAACAAANDELAAAVARHPTRFAGLAVLPMGDPTAATSELRRAVRDLGFRGALVDNHVDGAYYETADYEPFWTAAETLGVPVYLHPTFPTPDMAALYASPAYADNVGASENMAGSGFGWHSDVCVHVLRLFAAGVFDRHPRLKVVVGHFGEMIPFMLHRIQQRSVRWGKRARPFTDVYRENIWITTSGNWSLDPLGTILRNTPIDHIMYSVDYPFNNTREGLQWVKDLRDSGLVNRKELEMICYRNAEQLLGVKAPERAKAE